MRNFFRIIFYPLELLAILLLKLYKILISPNLPKSCIYMPTCSTYMLLAIKRFGVFRGFFLGIKRLSRCSRKHLGGIDLVPDNIKGDIKWVL